MGVSAIVALPLLGAILPPLFARAGRTPALLAALTPSCRARAAVGAGGGGIFRGAGGGARPLGAVSRAGMGLRIDGLGFSSPP